MKDILFIYGALSEEEKERYLYAIRDSVSASNLSCDTIEASDMRVGLLNFYHGFIFVNVGNSDRAGRFISKGKEFNKSFLQVAGVYAKGGIKNSQGLFDIVDMTIIVGDDSIEFVREGNTVELPETYSEHFLSQFDNVVKPEERDYYVALATPENVDESVRLVDRLLTSVSDCDIYYTGEEKGLRRHGVSMDRVRILNPNNSRDLFHAIRNSRGLFAFEGQVHQNSLLYDALVLSVTPLIEVDREVSNIAKEVQLAVSKIQSLKDLYSARYHLLHNKGAIYQASTLRTILLELLNPSIAINIPGSVIRGGVNVAMHHAKFLMDIGFDVTLLSDTHLDNEQNVTIDGREIPVVAIDKDDVECYFNKLVATLWNTTKFVSSYTKAYQKYYLVQGYETDFSPHGEIYKLEANKSYFDDNLTYVTISEWCRKWLTEKYDRKDVKFAPNGLDLTMFKRVAREPISGRKMKILIEGNSEEPFRGVDEAFEIVQSLDRRNFEIHYLSYVDSMKEWYDPDFTYFTVPYTKVAEVYSSCDVLLKCSTLESFSYPPLEMMATGGLCVIARNDGNEIYAKDGENCLLYRSGDKELASKSLMKLYESRELRDRLAEGGVQTAQNYSWDMVKPKIIDLYK